MATPDPDVKKAGVPTLHHLNHSQSQRILWLLEELDIEYNLVIYKRTKTYRAPDELKAVQELGKAPMLITSDGRVIIETSAIAAYLLKTYDPKGRFAAEDYIRDEVLTSFAGSTIGPVISTEMLFDMAAKHTPWPLVYLARVVRRGIQNSFTKAEFAKDLKYLEKEIGEKDWFNGDMLGRSDIMLSFPLDLVNMRGYVDYEKEYPRVAAWRKRIQEREAWKRGIVKGGSEYDLGSW